MADDGRYRETTWTGSESQRREQGQCPPPFRSGMGRARFTVPAGTKVAVRSVYRDVWLTHTTRKDNGFERFERWLRKGGVPYYEFRADGGWIMLVKAAVVVTRS